VESVVYAAVASYAISVFLSDPCVHLSTSILLAILSWYYLYATRHQETESGFLTRMLAKEIESDRVDRLERKSLRQTQSSLLVSGRDLSMNQRKGRRQLDIEVESDDEEENPSHKDRDPLSMWLETGHGGDRSATCIDQGFALLSRLNRPKDLPKITDANDEELRDDNASDSGKDTKRIPNSSADGVWDWHQHGFSDLTVSRDTDSEDEYQPHFNKS